MKLETVKRALWRIGETYPTVGGLLTKRPVGSEYSVGHNWALKMLDLAPDHFDNIIDDFAMMRRPLPNPADHLAQVIIGEVRDAMAIDDQRLQQHLQIHDHAQKHRERPWRSPSPPDLWCRIVKYVLAHKQGEAEIAILADWGRGDGPPPDFLPPEHVAAFFPNDFAAAGFDQT